MNTKQYDIQPPSTLHVSPLESELVNFCYSVVETGQIAHASKLELYSNITELRTVIPKVKKLLKLNDTNSKQTDIQKEHYKKLRSKWEKLNSSSVFTLLFNDIFTSQRVEAPKINSAYFRSLASNKNIFTINPPTGITVPFFRHQLIDTIYRIVTNGQVALIKELLSYKGVKGFKLATLRVESYLRISEDTLNTGRFTTNQKQHFKEIRQHWCEMTKEVLFMFLLDIGFPKKLKKKNTNSEHIPNLSSIKKITPLIRSQEIARYLQRVSSEEVGTRRTKQDLYRWGFFGSSTMDFDLWRKGE